MNKRLLVTGANGQVATEYQMSTPIDGWDIYFFERKDLNIVNIKNIAKVFHEILPDAVLNLAAYTNVEKAEKEETGKAFDANVGGPRNLAMACNKMNIPLIHISTDYVFDGNSLDPYTEKSIENPINHYGRTKFLGEKGIEELHDWYYILRVSWVYSNHAKNFYTTMLKFAQERSEVNIVSDQFGSPTSSKEICRAIDTILNNLDKEKSGLYHFAGMGRTSWKDFSEEIFRQLKVNIKVNGISSTAFPSKVERPCNSYMSSEKFAETFGYFPLHWKNALKEIITECKHTPIKVGDIVILDNKKHIIVSTDWLKRIARISDVDNLETSIEIPFELLML